MAGGVRDLARTLEDHSPFSGECPRNSGRSQRFFGSWTLVSRGRSSAFPLLTIGPRVFCLLHRLEAFELTRMGQLLRRFHDEALLQREIELFLLAWRSRASSVGCAAWGSAGVPTGDSP